MWIEKNKVNPKNNIFITQAWTKESKKPPSTFSRLKIISKYLKLYCRYSSLNSLKYLSDSQRPWFERILWVIIHYLIISALVFMVYISCKEFVTTPLLTSMETDSYKTTQLNFAGIAICSINRISRQSATELATNIFKANITNKTFDEISNLIMQLGNLYVSTFGTDSSLNVEVDNLLTTYYMGSYDITKIMKDLTPSCLTMLLKCKLHGIYTNCSQLFEFRKTQDGYCCTFNYAREKDDFPDYEPNKVEPIEIYKVEDLGIERGLTVVMDPLLDDYFYTIIPTMGWKVILFNPTDYPDVTSGGVTEILATPLSETFVDVTTTSFISTEIIRDFPKEKRNCIFSDEESSMRGDTMYTYSDCIVYCKIYDIQDDCGCRPFFYPRRGPKEYSWRICNSQDSNCLSKSKSKWLAIYPHEEITILETKRNALYCNSCYPACNDVTYKVLSWKSYMTPGGYNTNLLWNYNVTNEGVIHIYFSKYGTIRLRQDVSFYWYELMSDIGGICGVFIGFSFISVVEILYFFALVFRDLLYEKSTLQEDDNHKDEIPSNRTQTIRAIYWQELLPRSWHSAKYGKFTTNRARY